MSVVLGVVAVAALPAAVALAEKAAAIELLQAAAAVPLAAVAGIAALVVARGARRRVERTLGRVGGARVARVGRMLGVLGIALATSGAIAVAFYVVLGRVAE